MKISVELDGKAQMLELSRVGDQLQCAIDGRPIAADAVEITPGNYSILIGGQSFDIRVEPSGSGLRIDLGGREYLVTIQDPRHWRRRGGTLASEGRQQVIAPLPGKVVRVLVNAGDAVEAGQELLVVEAMKMQNEVRSPKSGTVERLLVAVGQTVRTGESLVIIG
ncbi:MAG: biotin/lipoyl-containing protein [Candidatus Acidiferrales bacterium]